MSLKCSKRTIQSRLCTSGVSVFQLQVDRSDEPHSGAADNQWNGGCLTHLSKLTHGFSSFLYPSTPCKRVKTSWKRTRPLRNITPDEIFFHSSIWDGFFLILMRRSDGWPISLTTACSTVSHLLLRGLWETEHTSSFCYCWPSWPCCHSLQQEVVVRPSPGFNVLRTDKSWCSRVGCDHIKPCSNNKTAWKLQVEKGTWPHCTSSRMQRGTWFCSLDFHGGNPNTSGQLSRQVILGNDIRNSLFQLPVP